MPHLHFQCSQQATGTSVTTPLLPTGPRAPGLCFWRGRQYEEASVGQLYAGGGTAARGWPAAQRRAPWRPPRPGRTHRPSGQSLCSAGQTTTDAFAASQWTRPERGTGSLAIVRNVRGAAAEGLPPGHRRPWQPTPGRAPPQHFLCAGQSLQQLEGAGTLTASHAMQAAVRRACLRPGPALCHRACPR